MNYDQILQELKSLAQPESTAGMSRVGIDDQKAMGVKVPHLRELGKKIGKDHELAQHLWDGQIRETMILAGIIDDPKQVTEEQLDQWVADFYDWEVCDQMIMNLFEKTPFAVDKAKEWCRRDEEFVKRAGFVMMARLAVSNKKAGDELFLDFFPFIREGATDERNAVKKAVNWAIRQIGERNMNLHSHCVTLAEEISGYSAQSANWVARDALRELNDEKIIARVRKKSQK